MKSNSQKKSQKPRKSYKDESPGLRLSDFSVQKRKASVEQIDFDEPGFSYEEIENIQKPARGVIYDMEESLLFTEIKKPIFDNSQLFTENDLHPEMEFDLKSGSRFSKIESHKRELLSKQGKQAKSILKKNSKFSSKKFESYYSKIKENLNPESLFDLSDFSIKSKKVINEELLDSQVIDYAFKEASTYSENSKMLEEPIPWQVSQKEPSTKEKINERIFQSIPKKKNFIFESKNKEFDIENFHEELTINLESILHETISDYSDEFLKLDFYGQNSSNVQDLKIDVLSKTTKEMFSSLNSGMEMLTLYYINCLDHDPQINDQITEIEEELESPSFFPKRLAVIKNFLEEEHENYREERLKRKFESYEEKYKNYFKKELNCKKDDKVEEKIQEMIIDGKKMLEFSQLCSRFNLEAEEKLKNVGSEIDEVEAKLFSLEKGKEILD